MSARGGSTSTVGQREIHMQGRVVAFFQDAPGYARLGDWRDRAGSTNIEETLLTGGWDKVVFLSEFYQLPAPLAEVVEDHTRVVLFAPRALSSMGRAERVRAVYLLAPPKK